MSTAGTTTFNQRAYNTFLSPWIVAVADPRASESYQWGTIDPATQGCLSCMRPPSLHGRRSPDVFELMTLGRVISVRSETDLFTGTRYSYLGDKDRLSARVATIMADTVRPTSVALAGQNPPIAGGTLQETTYLHSGEIETGAVDLDAGGRNGFDVVISRSYRSRSLGLGFLGAAWDSPLFKRLRQLPNGNVEYRSGAGDVWQFNLTNSGTYDSPKGVFLNLAATDRGWKLSDQRKRVSTFDKLGRITLDVDEYFDDPTHAGNAINYLYDGTGRLTTIVDPVGRVTTLDYYSTPAADGLLQTITDWRQRKLDYKYDNNRRLTDALMADVANTDSARPTTKYAYTSSTAAYNDRIELDKELKSITDPHEVATSGPARVAFEYETSGDQRDHVRSQRWATGETATFAYNGATEVTVTDALRQDRVYTIAGTGADARVSTMVEREVLTASAPFGQLPRSVLPGLVDASPQDRTWTFGYYPDGTMKSSDLNEVVTTDNLFRTIGTAPGTVLSSSTTSAAAGADHLTRTYSYAGATGAFLQSVTTAGPGSSITMNVPEPTPANVTPQNAPPVNSTNDSINSTTNYDQSGRIAASASGGGTVPGSGSSAQYTYKPDNSSQLFERGEIAQVNDGGLLTSYQYPTQDETTVIEPRSIATTTDYDTWRRPMRIARSGQPGSFERFEYDATGHLIRHSERQGSDTITTSYEYDAMGRQKSTTRDHVDVGGSPSSVMTRFDYDLAGRKHTTFLPSGGTVTHEVDGLGRGVRDVTSTGGTPIESRYAYDIAGNRVYSTDMKIATASAFDVHGREILTLNADGTTTTRQHDAGGRPTNVATATPTGTTVEQSKFTFSDTGRMKTSDTSVDATTSRSTQVGWDGAGRTTAVNVAGRGSVQTFDTAGLLLSSKAGEGSLGSITTAFTDQTFSDHTGTLPQQIATKEKSGATYATGRDYDANANVTREAVGNSLEWKQRFDETGNVVSASQPQRPAATFAYDSRGAVTNETKPDGAINNYQYDSSGSLKRYTDPVSEETRTEPDLLGRPLKRVYADGTIETFSYDGALLKTYEDRQGRIQNFTYNDRGQLTRIDRNGSPQLDQLDYDDAGRLVRWTNKDSAITWEEFNLDGRPAKTTLTVYKDGTGFGAHTIVGVFEQEHKWDEHGERTEWTMPRPHNFASTLPWTDRVRERRDAMGNVISVERSLFTGVAFTSLMSADFRNAARPNQRTVTTLCGSTSCRPASLVRQYDYDASTGMLDEMSVSSGPIVVAGSRITSFNGTQIGEAQILGVSGGAHAQQWSYDTRSRLQTTTNGRASTQNLSPADFRTGVDRTPRLDAATRAQLVARGVDVDRIDPPSQTAGETTGHKISNVVDGASVRTFSYNGSERNDDGKFRYEFDEKGRLTRATQMNGQMRVTYTYDANDRMVTRLVETGTASGVWTVATSAILTDGIPGDAIFVWDPLSDRLAAIFDASNGALSRQILHGGLGYDDPIEVTLTEPTDITKINRLYPIYDEAAAGHLQAVVNVSGEMVSRKITADSYGDDAFSIAGAGIDLVQIAATTDNASAPTKFDVTLRSTEELVASTVTSGVRLAAVDGSGHVLRTTSVQPTLADANTANFALTASEWTALTANAAGVSIAVTNTLRASAWGADLPLLPAPEWATATRPVFSSSSTPIEIRESISALSTWVTSIGANAKKTNTLYEVTDLALMGSDAETDDPARFLVASPFHALPFFDSATRLTQVRARWLDHSTGTFLTVDPIGYRDSSNLYTYCAGDPVNYRDPAGFALYAFDGTWNDRDKMKNPTNVAKLASAYSKEVVYQPGVGNHWYSSLLGGASGLGARLRLESSFKELQDIYNGRNGHARDRDIDIIGFSRGAAEGREFANMIQSRGIRDDETGQVVHPKIRFLGVFDTVASFGIPGNDTNFTYRLGLPPIVETARQAIAGNEYRGPFPLSSLSNPDCPDARVEQKVFPGAHSDIGGGYEDNDQLSRPPLVWMWIQMEQAGLPMKQLPASQTNMHGEGVVHEPYRDWKYLPTWLRVWWKEKHHEDPGRAVFYPQCSGSGLH